MTGPKNLTATQILELAHTRGVPAFDTAPVSFIPHKILLGSLVDVADPTVSARLLELHRKGEISLCRVDMAAAVPAARRDMLEASAIRSAGSLFDCLAVEGWTAGGAS